MSQNTKIQLNCTSVKKIILDSYCKDFTFIVNGEEFKTSRLVSELLSPKIINIRMNDPTNDHFIINTSQRGDFSTILGLVTFKITEIESKDIEFVSEVLEILNNDSIKINIPQREELSTDNVISELKKHEKHKILYNELFESDIEYAATHFNELLTSHKEELSTLDIDTLERLISNEHLRLENEDQLLKFVNELFESNVKYSILYESVYFNQVSQNCIAEFVNMFEMMYLNERIWTRLCERLVEEIKIGKQKMNERYKDQPKSEPIKEGQMFSPSQQDQFSGIINHLRNKSNNHIEQEIEVTASSIGCSSTNYQPQTVLMKENPNNYFYTNNEPDSWLKLNFKEHRIIPTDYTIRSGNPSSSTWHHPRSWVIEVSNDDKTWEKIDEVNNDSILNGSRRVHTFKIQKQESTPFQYIRIRQTNTTMNGFNNFLFETIEFYGTLI